MATFESSIRQIDYPQERVYALLSDMNNIDKVKDRIPEDKANGLTFDANSIGINTPMGAVKLVIVSVKPLNALSLKQQKVRCLLTFGFRFCPYPKPQVR